MSVRKNDRTEGDLTVIVKAKELAAYTLRITHNEKVFPKRYRFSMTERILEKTMNILTELIEANELYPHNKAEFEARQLKQRRAMANCRSLLTLIDLCYEAFNIDTGKIEFWTRSVVEVRKLTIAWLRKDEERFIKFQN